MTSEPDHKKLGADLFNRTWDLMEKSDQIGDFDLAFAYEALARAYAVAGDMDESARWLAKARAASAEIADPEDRDLLRRDLTTIPTSSPA